MPTSLSRDRDDGGSGLKKTVCFSIWTSNELHDWPHELKREILQPDSGPGRVMDLDDVGRRAMTFPVFGRVSLKFY